MGLEAHNVPRSIQKGGTTPPTHPESPDQATPSHPQTTTELSTADRAAAARIPLAASSPRLDRVTSYVVAPAQAKQPDSTETATSQPSEPLSPREQLVRSCLNNDTVENDLALVPGAYAEYDVPDDAKDTSEGEFGLVIKSTKTGEPIARSGFDMDRDGQRIIIGHPPQGARRSEVSSSGVFGEIVKQGDTFRTRLVNGIVSIAQQLGVAEVVGISAEYHLGVQYNHIPPDKGTRIMDDVYSALGFVQDPTDRNFHLRFPLPETPQK